MWAALSPCQRLRSQEGRPLGPGGSQACVLPHPAASVSFQNSYIPALYIFPLCQLLSFFCTYKFI